jgi:hypothetical protein
MTPAKVSAVHHWVGVSYRAMVCAPGGARSKANPADYVRVDRAPPGAQSSGMNDPKGWHGRGYLPHFDSPESVQHVVFRTAGSLPDALMEGLPEDVARRRTMVDTALDRSTSGYLLRRPDAATIVENAIRYFDGQRYRLLAWCVMPNHVHVVLEQMLGWNPGRLCAPGSCSRLGR